VDGEYLEIPVNTMADLYDYKAHGKPPGGFLRRVLENAALFDVVGHADDAHARALKPITKWIYNELPSQAWGSHERVAEWIGSRAGRPNLQVMEGGR
jgi:hypothetical protein